MKEYFSKESLKIPNFKNIKHNIKCSLCSTKNILVTLVLFRLCREDEENAIYISDCLKYIFIVERSIWRNITTACTVWLRRISTLTVVTSKYTLESNLVVLVVAAVQCTVVELYRQGGTKMFQQIEMIETLVFSYTY